MYFIKAIFAAAILGLAVSGPAQRAQAEDVVIVLDASGSMWGQIDGENKIVIARSVLGDLLSTTPDDRRIGLVAYGHNRKGDCTDIEELAPVGTARQSMIDTVNAINPKGKTPLSKAVMVAAETLRYTEEKATVVLISDGIETCDLDPCEVANSLEELGVDFTAHVVGFDVTDVEANRQLQCLAENTGGQFISASNAGELSKALEQTVAAPVAPPALPQITLRATEMEGGPAVTDVLDWRVRQSGQGAVMLETAGVGPVAEIAAGTYDVTATRASDGATGQVQNVSVKAGASLMITVPLVIPVEATLRAEPQTTVAGADVIVFWDGPDRNGDYISFAPQDDSPTYFATANTRDGTPAKLRAPVEPGSYEIRYILADPYRVLARLPFEVGDVTATLDAAETVSVGAGFHVDWTGPGYDDDFVTVVAPDSGDSAYASYANARDGNSLRLTAPLEPGDYELRYVLANTRVIARKPVTVTDVAAALDAPDTVTAGSTVTVNWTGPDTDRDYITITAPDAPDTKYNSYANTRDGTPASLQAPLAVGDYEFRYVQGSKKVIARKPVSVTAVEAAIAAPARVTVGSAINVSWTGPDTERDFITITAPDADDSRYMSYAYTRDGADAVLVAPLEAGRYEYRYVQSGKKVLFRLPLDVEDAAATLDAPVSVGAGQSITVNWTGPDNDKDFLTITEPDASGGSYMSYGYTRDGAAITLAAPLEPGAYEYRYVLNGKRVLERLALTVIAVDATVTGPETAAPDTEISVDWTGPDTARDFITITGPEQSDGSYKGYQYTGDGSPASFKTPKEPGTYEIRYVQSGKKVLARQLIEVR